LPYYLKLMRKEREEQVVLKKNVKRRFKY